MEKIQIAELLEKFKHLETYQYGILAGIVLLLFILFALTIVKSFKKASARKVAPNFKIEHVLVAPLGMGVQIKLKNLGYPVTILKTGIMDRPNVHITQAFENYIFETGKTYLIFCEATDRRRADTGFTMRIFYKDKLNHKLNQDFFIEAKQSKLLKLKFA